MRPPAFLLAAVVALTVTEAAMACVPLPPGVGPKRPSVQQLMDYSPAVMKGTVEEIDPNHTKDGALRIREIEWVKGNGPRELIVYGFPNLRGIPTSCGSGPNGVKFGDRYLFLLELPPRNGAAALLQPRDTEFGTIYRAVFSTKAKPDEN
jgi:hypothetical protein